MHTFTYLFENGIEGIYLRHRPYPKPLRYPLIGTEDGYPCDPGAARPQEVRNHGAVCRAKLFNI